MLDFGIINNTWVPPQMDEDDYRIVYEEAANQGSNPPECLVIFQVEPYIDSVYCSCREPKADLLMKRFTFHEDYVWSHEDEVFFSDRILNNRNCGYAYSTIEDIYSIYSKAYPDWKLQRYYTKPFRLLDHIYHCTRKGTAKEILYKAGLDELAANIDTLDAIDILSSKPSDIYDGISIRVLRALNCRNGARLLETDSTRRMLKELQMKAPNIFQEKLNDAQCSYLKYLIEMELSSSEIGRLYLRKRRMLYELWNYDQYKMFLIKERNAETGRMVIEELDKIDSVYGSNLRRRMKDNQERTVKHTTWLKELLLDNRAEYDRKIRVSNRRRDDSWQERTDKYIVRYPQTINDFCKEAVYMNNCLLGYAYAVADGDTTIMFIRRVENPNVPFISMEIYNGEMSQAYHRFDEDCTEEEVKWIRAYCKRHGIRCDKFHFNINQDLR